MYQHVNMGRLLSRAFNFRCVKISTTIGFFLLFTFQLFAQKNAIRSGNWNDISTWDSGIPGSTDDVVIAANYTVTVNNTGAACQNLRLGLGNILNSGTLTFSGTSSLTVTNQILMGDQAGALGTLSLSSNATLTTGSIAEDDVDVSGDYSTNYGTVVLTGTGTLPNNLFQFNNLVIQSGSTMVGASGLQIDGDLSVLGGTLDTDGVSAYRNSVGGTLTIANGATLRIGGSGTLPFNFNTHNIGATSNINYYGVSQTVALLNSSQSYGTLVISGTGTKQINGNINIAGDLQITGGIFNLNSYSVSRTSLGGTLQVNAGCTLRITGSATMPSNFATYSLASTSTVDYRGSSPQQIAVLNAGAKYGNLSINNSNKSLAGDITVGGTLTFGASSFKLSIGNNTLTLEGDISNSASGTRNFVGDANSKLILSGAYNRTLYMDQTTPGTTNQLNQLTINHNHRVTALGNDLLVTDTLHLTSGNLHLADRNLTLNGVIINTEPEALQGATGSNLTLKGSVSSSINFDQSAPGSSNALASLIVNKSGGTVTLLNHLSLNGDLTIQSGTLNTDGYAIDRASLGGTLAVSDDATLKIGGTATLPANYDTHNLGSTGTIDYSGSNQSVSALRSGIDYNHLTISGSGVKTLAADIAVIGTLSFRNNAILAIGNQTLTINGDVNNVTSGGLRGGSTSNIIVDGVNDSPTLSFDQTTPGTTNLLNNLTIDNSSQTVTLGNKLLLTGVLTPNSGYLNANGQLHLVSNASGTASVAAGANAGGYITGDVTVERYISSGRKWHFLSVPVEGTQSIQDAWQEGEATGSSNSNGYGTWITSAQPNATALGFDAQSNTVSLKTYNPSSNNWTEVSSTYNTLSAAEGYMIWIRGDRGCTSSNSTTTATVLRATGPLKQGTQSSLTVTANKNASIANPFPSAIDFRNITKSGSIDNIFYVWDPKLTGALGFGAYQTFTFNGTNYTVTPGGGSYGSGGSINNTIQSGQAFFVHATGSAGTVQIEESAKSSGSILVSRPTSPDNTAQNIRVNFYANTFAPENLIDGTLAEYGASYSNSLNAEDARKLGNTGENLCIQNGIEYLVVERRNSIQANDSLLFYASGLKPRNYVIEVLPLNIENSGATAYLVDRFTNTEMPLISNTSNQIPVVVTNTAASKATNRWFIVYKSLGTLPVRFISVNAGRTNHAITVNWKVANEQELNKYEIERSLDGLLFRTCQTISASNANANQGQYQITDLQAPETTVFYRVKSIDIAGKTQLSAIVKVAPIKNNQQISIVPNPVTNHLLNLDIALKQAGKYQLALVNQNGVTVWTQSIILTTGNTQYGIHLPTGIAKGIYQLKVTNDNDYQQVITAFIQ
ncbi:MAG: hypothetical protein RLY16_295 [Bacteroidota bacterium]